MKKYINFNYLREQINCICYIMKRNCAHKLIRGGVKEKRKVCGVDRYRLNYFAVYISSIEYLKIFLVNFLSRDLFSVTELQKSTDYY